MLHMVHLKIKSSSYNIITITSEDKAFIVDSEPDKIMDI